MKVFVTGATGFVGQNLCRYFAEKGYSVKAFGRSRKKLDALKSENVSTYRGDVRNRSDLEKAIPGHDIVVNLAALFNNPEASWEDYRATNVKAVKTILDVSKQAGVKRVIHCSTVGVAIGTGQPPFDEDTPYSPPRWDKYEKSKTEGEKLALAFSRDHHYPVVVIRPAQVYGPGDLSKLKFYKLVKRGAIVNPGKTLKHPIYIRDLCRAFELAVASDKALGQSVIIAGNEVLPLREMVQHVASALDVPKPKIILPVFPMLVVCAGVEVIFRLLKKKAPIHRRSMDFFTKSVSFRTDKAKSLLDFKSKTSIKEGIARTADWYRNEGYLS